MIAMRATEQTQHRVLLDEYRDYRQAVRDEREQRRRDLEAMEAENWDYFGDDDWDLEGYDGPELNDYEPYDDDWDWTDDYLDPSDPVIERLSTAAHYRRLWRECGYIQEPNDENHPVT
ncbi:MAG: hypothetical protein PHU85_01985 [Phycisphaerae bacterium]|nr:hypothetical protein [Phycisphaerae bacterium]